MTDDHFINSRVESNPDQRAGRMERARGGVMMESETAGRSWEGRRKGRETRTASGERSKRRWGRGDGSSSSNETR